MESALYDALRGLIASGPVAALLGFVAWKLWEKLQATEAELRQLHEEQKRTYKQLAGLEDSNDPEA